MKILKSWNTLPPPFLYVKLLVFSNMKIISSLQESESVNNAEQRMANDGVEALSFTSSSDERKRYLESIGATYGYTHEINRSNLFQDVLNLYKDEDVAKEYPLVIEFTNERGIDQGGLA